MATYLFTAYQVGTPLNPLGSSGHPLIASITPDFEPFTADSHVKLNIQFSAPVTDFGVSDITVSAGKLSGFTGIDNFYTVILSSPTSGTGSITVRIAKTAVSGLTQDAHIDVDYVDAVEFGVNFFAYQVGTPSNPFGSLPPPLSVSMTPEQPIIDQGASVLVRMHFTKDVTDFTLNDISLTGGTLTNFQGIDRDYSVVLTAPAVGKGIVTLTIPKEGVAGLVEDATAQVEYIETEPITYNYFAWQIANATPARADIFVTPPADQISIDGTITPRATEVQHGQRVIFDIMFSNDVVGFDFFDLVVSAGLLVNFQGSGKAYSVELVAPTTGEGLISLTIPANRVSRVLLPVVGAVTLVKTPVIPTQPVDLVAKPDVNAIDVCWLPSDRLADDWEIRYAKGEDPGGTWNTVTPRLET